MQPDTAYRLKTAMLGVARDSDERWTPILVPADAVLTVVEVTGETLVSVLWDNKEVTVFAVDLKSRSEVLEPTTATS